MGEKLKLIVSIFLSLALCAVSFGVKCYAIDKTSYGNSYANVGEIGSSQDQIYDDHGSIITEEEILKYTNPDPFWYTLRNVGAAAAIGVFSGVVYGYIRNDSLVSLAYGAAGGIGGSLVGYIISSIFPPKKITRDEAIETIKQKRLEQKKIWG